MLVSIIIPTYNSQNFLKRCLDSVINQIYKKIEIIVVDDASEDDTKKIIKYYSEKDSRIIPYFQSLNKGVSISRNIGLKAASGDYIMFLDSDDELTKDAIRRMVDISNRYKSDFVDSYNLLEYKKKNGKIVRFTEKRLPKKTLVLGNINDNIKILNMNTYIKGKLIKKSLFDGLEFDENLRCYEDLVLEHKLKRRLNNYTLINKPIYIYYQREDSLINTFGENHLFFLEAARKVKENYKECNKQIRDEIESMLFNNMFLTCLTKVVKNEDSIDNNVMLAKNFLKEIIQIFPQYKENKKINILIKKYIYKFTNNEIKLKNFIKKTKNINFISLYFNYLSIVNRYKGLI